MPNVRLTLDSNQPLFIPASSILNIETVLPDATIKGNPDRINCNCNIAYDLGNGLVYAFLSTSGEVVAEQVNGDPTVLILLLKLDASTGPAWVFPSFIKRVQGLAPLPAPNGDYEGEPPTDLHEFKVGVQVRIPNSKGDDVFNNYVCRDDPEAVQAQVDKATAVQIPNRR